jgi:methyl coenzyme M reductase subunit C-like uncharacterized protein (methanogenesis marker protein 7)
MEDIWTISFPGNPWSIGRKGRIIKKKELKEYNKWKEALYKLIEQQGELFSDDRNPCPISITIENDYNYDYTISDPSPISLSLDGDFKVVTQSSGPSLISTIDISETDEYE